MERLGRRLRWGFAITVALMIAATCFCVFDFGHDPVGDHGMSPDLCAGLLVFSLTIPLLAGPGVHGWYRPAFARSTYVTRIRVLDPPPKF